MTRRDYERIASALAFTRPPPANTARASERDRGRYSQWVSDVVGISAALAEENPQRFDRNRFIGACER